MFTIAAATFTANVILDPDLWHLGATLLSYGALFKVIVQFYLGNS